MLLVIDLTEDPDIQAELLIDQLQRWNIHIRTRDEILQSPDKAPVGVFKKTLIAAK